MAPRRKPAATTDPSPETPATPTETETAASDASAPDNLPATVTAGPTELDTFEVPDDGFGEAVTFKPLELRINRAKGQFWLAGDDEYRTELILIPRGCHKAQVFYGLPYDPKEKHEPSCQSLDAKIAYGWIDAGTQDNAARKCISCPRKGFGAGSCTDLMKLLAWDVERAVPVMLTFQNAELNPRKGAFTLAVNRFRSMGLRPQDTAMRISFADTDAAYKALVFDVAPASGATDQEALTQIQQTLDVCWAAYEDSRGYAVQELLDIYQQEAVAA